MSYSVYSSIWPLVGLLFGGLEIAAAVFLLRERGGGPWLMLIGSGIAVVGRVAIPFIMPVINPSDHFLTYTAVSSFATLGSLTFGIGLLLHALQRRALGNRIAELDAILATRQDQ